MNHKTKPFTQLFSQPCNCICKPFLGFFTNRNDSFPYSFIYFNPLIHLKPENGIPFGRSLSLKAILGSTPGDSSRLWVLINNMSNWNRSKSNFRSLSLNKMGFTVFLTLYHRKKKQIPNTGYFRVFKEYPQKSQIWQNETSPNQGIPNQVPWLGLVSLFQLWDFCGYSSNNLKYPKMGICYFFLWYLIKPSWILIFVQ